jgi:protein TonB
MLHGVYIEYFPNGDVQVRGNYQNNLKHQEWYYYNDTGKHFRTETFEAGKLLKTENPDTIARKKDSIVYKDEREAVIKGGKKAWIKYLQEHMNSNVALQSVRGGQVRVQFRVTKEGEIADIYLKKSVEFILDEEALRVVRSSPKWIPAFQNGKPLNAYRVQPLTFIKD